MLKVEVMMRPDTVLTYPTFCNPDPEPKNLNTPARDTSECPQAGFGVRVSVSDLRFLISCPGRKHLLEVLTLSPNASQDNETAQTRHYDNPIAISLVNPKDNNQHYHGGDWSVFLPA